MLKGHTDPFSDDHLSSPSEGEWHEKGYRLLEGMSDIEDWDWDLAGSLKHMYKLPRKRSKPSQRPTQHGEYQFLSSCACPDSVSNPSTGNLKDGRLHVETVVDGALNEVQVPVRSPTGEITYKTFIGAPPSTFSQGSANERLAEKAQGESDLYSFTNGIRALTAPDTSDHQHVLHDRN